MSNKKDAASLLKRYLIARIPLIVLKTIETARALDMIRDVSLELVQEGWLDEKSFYAHTMSKGVYNLFTNQAVGNTGSSVLSAMDFTVKLLRQDQKLNQTMVLTEVPDISGENGDSQRILDLISLASEMYGTVIVFYNNSVWNTLQRHGLIVTLDMPDEEEMYALIKGQLDGEATNVMSALLAKGIVKKEDMAEVRSAKNRLFSNISGLERIDVDPAMKDVGGLKGLRDWLDEKKELLKPEKKEVMKKLHLQPPRGILLVGVPGCGKSMSAKAISASWKLPLYRLDFATAQGSYVGQSEQQPVHPTMEGYLPVWWDSSSSGSRNAKNPYLW